MEFIAPFEEIAIEKGMQQGLQQSIRNLYLNGFDPEKISSLLKVDKDLVDKTIKEERDK